MAVLKLWNKNWISPHLGIPKFWKYFMHHLL